jgi:hypothetical protein
MQKTAVVFFSVSILTALVGCVAPERQKITLIFPDDASKVETKDMPKAAEIKIAPKVRVGLRPLIESPSVPATQAIAICKPQAEYARDVAGNAYSPSAPSSRTARCNRDYFGNYNCTDNTYVSKYEVIGDAIGRGSMRRRAFKSAYSSCLAQYGWSE